MEGTAKKSDKKTKHISVCFAGKNDNDHKLGMTSWNDTGEYRPLSGSLSKQPGATERRYLDQNA